MIGERTTILLWHHKDLQAWLFLKEVSYADTTWCNALKDYFQLFSMDLYNVQTGNEV